MHRVNAFGFHMLLNPYCIEPTIYVSRPRVVILEEKYLCTDLYIQSCKIQLTAGSNRQIIAVQGPSAPNCIKDFLDLPDHTGQSGLTLQLILVNQVWRYNCFHWKQL